MATNFPSVLDVLVNPTSNTILDGAGNAALSHAAQHANANDAIEAIQATIGVTNSNDTSSIQYKVNTNFLPTGTIVQNFTPSPSFSANWLKLDGSAVTRSNYSGISSQFPDLYTASTARTNAYTPTTYPAVCYGNGIFVCVGGTAAISTSASSSTDGITWTVRAMPTSAIWGNTGNQDTAKSVVYVAGAINRFVAVGAAAAGGTATNAYSTNGTTWTTGGALPTGLTTSNLALATDGVTNVVCTSKTLTARAIGYSANGGTTWTLATLTGSSVAGVLTVVWAPKLALFVVTAAGHPGSYWTSPTGATWTQRTAPAYTSTSVLKFLVNNATEFVMYSTSGYAVTTSDGINWTDITYQFPDFASIATYAGNGRSIGETPAYVVGTNTLVLTESRQFKTVDPLISLSGIYGNACTNGTTWVGVHGTTFALHTFTRDSTQMLLDRSATGQYIKGV